VGQAGKYAKNFKSRFYTLVIETNGTAIEGVCVTWRNPPVDYPGCEQGKNPGGPPGMAQFLQSRRIERV
jgi:hypothetical protein